uniref:Monooxygenase, DBH-like 1, like n=1 Tax=Salarias fasciatus TaxID=181472 RepID=A0A672I0U6_SALFA
WKVAMKGNRRVLRVRRTCSADTNMPFMEYLDHDRLVSLKWGFDSLQGNITFQLVVNSTGWVGFGLSPNGGMQGSDIVIGGLGSDGSYFTDRHATGNSMPLVDEHQDYTLLYMTEDEGQTSMTFQRSIQACDEDDFHITAQPVKVIYAYGTTDEIKNHGSRRGTKEINLLSYMPRTTPNSSGYFSITIPAIKTYYHCKVMTFPKLDKKHHVYLIEPVIDNPDIVHHMLLYRCPPFVTEQYDNPCYRGDQGDACFVVVASWGVGGEIFEFLENVGIPVGDKQSDTYRLEIHYNNPQAKAGITDSSGLKLHYTAQLREHDVGILFMGLLPMGNLKYEIPPKVDLFRTYGSCDTSTFTQLVNAWSDLHVFASLLHTHLAGRKVRVGHFRDGKQIDFLGVDENYNFEMQQAVNLGNIKTIQQGDEIVIECTYSTSNRTDVTQLGLATTDEMCLAFLFYYPAIPIGSCISHPDTTYLPTKAISYNVLSFFLQNNYIVDNVTIRDLMATPTVSCERSRCTKLCASWMVNTAGITILFLWIVIT